MIEKEKKHIFEALFHNTPDAVAMIDQELRIIDINTKFIELFGYTLEECKGKCLYELIVPEHILNKSGRLDKKVKANKTFSIETQRIDKYGNIIDVSLKLAPISSNCESVGAYAIYTDITKIKENKIKLNKLYKSLEKQKDIMESLFNHSSDGVVYLDKKARIININKRFTEIFGYTLDECRYKNIDDLISQEDNIEVARSINRLALDDKEFKIEAVRKRKDGKLIPVRITGGPTIVNNELIGCFGIYTDITEQKEAEEKIRFLSFHDSLTSLYNRRFFDEELNRLDAKRQLPLSLIIGDLDDLKIINDTWGHYTGDRVLVKTAEILKESCREEDIVTRSGGDEFSILLPQTTEFEAEKISERIREKLRKVRCGKIRISISLGYATKKDMHQPIDEIVKLADDKMYEEKNYKKKFSM